MRGDETRCPTCDARPGAPCVRVKPPRMPDDGPIGSPLDVVHAARDKRAILKRTLRVA